MFSLTQSVTIASLAAIIDFLCGYSQILVNSIGHPVGWIGRLIGWLDTLCNRTTYPAALRYILGVLTLCLTLVVTVGLTTGLLALGYVYLPSWLMLIAQIVMGSAFLAQKSLWDHVFDVKEALKLKNLDLARTNVGKIVGRDTRSMDEVAIIRATLESLSENFSDGVVAPLLYFALLGLPGVVFYKSVNTADSMIGHLSKNYKAFGWGSAKLDDVLNYIPARISAYLILFIAPIQIRSILLQQVRRQAPLQRSPNAGWPESAFAAVLGVSLGGPKSYDGVKHFAPRMGVQTHPMSVYDISRGLWVYKRACVWLVYTLVFLGLFLQLTNSTLFFPKVSDTSFF